MEMLASLLLAHAGVHTVTEANNLPQLQGLAIEKFKQVANEQTSIDAEDFIDLITLVYLTTPLQELRDAVLEVALWHKKSLLESATFVTALSTRLELQPFANDFTLAVSAISEVDAVENMKLRKQVAELQTKLAGQEQGLNGFHDDEKITISKEMNNFKSEDTKLKQEVSELKAAFSKKEDEYKKLYKTHESFWFDYNDREREVAEKVTQLKKLGNQLKKVQGELNKLRNDKQNNVPQPTKLAKAEKPKLDNHYSELQNELSSWQINYQKLQKNNEMLEVDLRARERELKAAQEKLSKASNSSVTDPRTEQIHKIGQQVVAFEEIKRCRNPSCNGIPTAKQKAKGAVQEPFRFYLEKSKVGFMARCAKCGSKHII